MYAGVEFTAQSTCLTASATAFRHVMEKTFNANVTPDTGNTSLQMLTATGFYGDRESCYEITLSLNPDTNRVTLTAWGDASEMNSDTLLITLKPLADTLQLDEITGHFSEMEVDEEEADTFALTLPDCWTRAA